MEAPAAALDDMKEWEEDRVLTELVVNVPVNTTLSLP